jgi:thiol:disulfide interchange protein DsbD
MRKILWALAVVCLAAAVPAQAAGPHARLELVPEGAAASPGAFRVAVRLSIDPGWHLYWKNPGDSGQAPSFGWELPAGVRFTGLDWPYPERLDDASGAAYGYRDEAVFIAHFESSNAARDAVLTVHAKWLACEKTCVPEEGTAQAALSASSGSAALFAAAEKRIPYSNPHWLFSPILDGRTIYLAVLPPEDARVPQGLRFFPEDPRILDPHAPQAVTGTPQASELSLPLSGNAPPPARLKGVLVADSAWEKWDARQALEIDAPVAVKPKENEHAV